MTSKNANRTTTIKGFIVTLEPLNKEPFEIVTPYTRSDAKAGNLVAEQMEVKEGQIITITELINEPLKKTAYDAQLVYDFMRCDFETKEEAEAAINVEEIVIAYTMYYYGAEVWYYLADDNAYYTAPYTDCSPLKFGVVDSREFVKMGAEDYFNAQIIGMHDVTREEVKRYAIVSTENAKQCEKVQA